MHLLTFLKIARTTLPKNSEPRKRMDAGLTAIKVSVCNYRCRPRCHLYSWHFVRISQSRWFEMARCCCRGHCWLFDRRGDQRRAGIRAKPEALSRP